MAPKRGEYGPNQIEHTRGRRALAVAGTLPDKIMVPVVGYFGLARERGLAPQDIDTDELLVCLLRAALGE